MKDLEKDLPADVEAGIAFDNTVFIRNSINEVKDTIFEAFVLVVLIIFLFLRNWRTTLIPKKISSDPLNPASLGDMPSSILV